MRLKDLHYTGLNETRIKLKIKYCEVAHKYQMVAQRKLGEDEATFHP